MTTEEDKNVNGQDQQFHPPGAAPFQYGGGSFPPVPPPGFPGAPYFYPPPADNAHTEGNGANAPPPGAPVMMYPPPGMVFAAFPPPTTGQGFQQPPSSPNSANSSNRPKRRQVKMACTNCASACKRCDEGRPCERCLKYGLQDSCVDGQRKERKKGVKRGPYKRKQKLPADAAFAANDTADWNSNPASAATTQAAIHAVAPFAPEGSYYPIFYPGYIPPLSEGQPPPPADANGHPPVMPYYIPAGYPPPFPYPPYGVIPPPPGTQGQALDNPVANKDGVSEDVSAVAPPEEVNGKKRSKSNKETKGKKASKGSPRKKDADGAEESDS